MSIDHQLDDRREKERRIRATEHEAQTNLAAVLQLCATGKLRCSEKTRRPSAATVAAVTEVLDSGDFYDRRPSPPSPGQCCSRQAASPSSPPAGWR